MIGLITGLALAQPSLDRALTDLKDARESVTFEMMEMRNCGLGITAALHNATTSVLNLTVENSGSNVIELSDMDVLLNGTYVTGAFGPSGLLYPGQAETVSIRNVTDPRSVRVIGPWGLSDTTASIGRG